jgi:hypothetical protein
MDDRLITNGIPSPPKKKTQVIFIGLAYQGKDIVFRFIIEYSSFRDFYRPLGNK